MTFFQRLWALVQREPVIVPQALAAALTLGTAFGLRLSPQETIAVTGAGQLVATIISRAMVVPSTVAAAREQSALYRTPPDTPPTAANP